MQIRPVTAEDFDLLADFSAAVPDSIAVEGPSVAGMVAVRRGAGASRHVGEVTLIVAPNHRGRGVGRALAEAALMHSIAESLTHVFVEVSAEDVGTIRMFERLGFAPEAMLRDFILDANGDHHDLIVLTHNAEELFAEHASLGLAGEV